MHMASDRPLGGFVKWLLAVDGGRPLAQAMQAHTALACHASGVRSPELRRMLGEGRMRSLIDAAVADLATRVLDGTKTFADLYLDGVGAHAPEASREYLTIVRDSGMSLYRVEKVQQGMGFIAQDLLFRGPWLPVMAASAARGMQTGDFVCARMLRRRGVTELAPGHFVLPAAAGRRLQSELTALLARAEDRIVALKDYAFMFSNAWAAHELEAAASAARAYRQSA
jgi:hypothetical protein